MSRTTLRSLIEFCLCEETDGDDIIVHDYHENLRATEKYILIELMKKYKNKK